MYRFTGFGPVDWLYFALFLIGYVARVFAFADALIRRGDAFPAAGKLTKLAWCAILGIGAVVGLASWNPISLFNLAGVIAAIVYLVDVRPAVREIGRPGRNQGPYGSW